MICDLFSFLLLQVSKLGQVKYYSHSHNNTHAQLHINTRTTPLHSISTISSNLCGSPVVKFSSNLRLDDNSHVSVLFGFGERKTKYLEIWRFRLMENWKTNQEHGQTFYVIRLNQQIHRLPTSGILLRIPNSDA